MLAYGLYCENENSNQDSGYGKPIKKIFVNDNIVTVDSKALNSFGSISTPDQMINYLQKTFDMPLDTSKSVNLPNKLVATRAAKPYIRIDGYIKVFYKKDIVSGELTLGNKKQGYHAKLSIPDYESEIIAGDISLNIDSQKYQINDTLLYDVYCKNKIINNDKLDAKLFQSIAEKFFDFIISKDATFPKGKTSFMLYVLPNDNKITYFKEQQKDTIKNIDSFGNITGNYPNSPTTGVFFMSYDDKAFTINCKEGSSFYNNLGIGKKSHKKILLPKDKMMNIYGFNWYFLDLSDKQAEFTKRNRGIYDQIYHNYTQIKKDIEIKNKLSQLKVFCIKKTNAKLEVMIDENLSMPRLDVMFSGVKSNEIKPPALELLIIKKGKKTFFKYYIMAIKSFLNQTPFNPDLLVKIFTDIIHNEIRNWVTDKLQREPCDFFVRSEHCRKILNHARSENTLMNAEASFANKVGLMTRIYVDFRRKNKLDNNSLTNILTKQKYDMNTLSFVINQIGRGIHLLNISKEKYDVLLNEISANTPNQDGISLESRKDMSYYFYMGYFGGKSS